MTTTLSRLHALIELVDKQQTLIGSYQAALAVLQDYQYHKTIEDRSYDLIEACYGQLFGQHDEITSYQEAQTRFRSHYNMTKGVGLSSPNDCVSECVAYLVSALQLEKRRLESGSAPDKV